MSGAVDYVKKAFDWLDIMPDEGYNIGGNHGPYIQSERKEIYKKYVDKLVESGHAYYAFDTKEDLAKMRADFEDAGVKGGYTGVVRDRMKNSLTMSGDNAKSKVDSGEAYTIRFKMPRAEDVKFHDEVRGWVKFNTKDLDDKVIWKSSDGLPTYHLANVIDDHLMEISHVIRGEEWLSATPLHVLLYKAFDWDLPIFAHLPLLLGEDGKKLSKRHGDKYGYPIFPLTWDYTTHENKDAHVTGFKHEGYEPDALLNFLVLLGWNPKNNVEIMSIKDMIDLFSLESVNKAGAMFDKKKLLNFNSHYLRSKSYEWIVDRMNLDESFIASMSHDKQELIASMAVERAMFSYELKDSLSYIYKTPVIDDDFKRKNIDEFVKVMNIFVDDDFMEDFDDKEWTPKNIRYELEHISSNMTIKVGKIMPMLRVAICGGASGPQLPDVMYVVGPKESKLRIDTLLNKIKELA